MMCSQVQVQVLGVVRYRYDVYPGTGMRCRQVQVQV